MGAAEIVAQGAPQGPGFPRTAQITIRKAIGRDPGLVRRRNGTHYLYLSADEHRQLWRGIQARAPELAAFIQGDFAAQLRETFNAELVLEAEALRTFMEVGK